MTRPRIHIHSLAGDTPLMTTCLTDDKEYTPLRPQKQPFLIKKTSLRAVSGTLLSVARHFPEQGNMMVSSDASGSRALNK